MHPGHTEQVTVVCLVREVDNPNSTRAAARRENGLETIET